MLIATFFAARAAGCRRRGAVGLADRLPGEARARSNGPGDPDRRRRRRRVVERVPPPRRGYVWVPGHWAWRRGRYVWVRGGWVAAAARLALPPAALGPAWRPLGLRPGRLVPLGAVLDGNGAASAAPFLFRGGQR